jgi:hypothetical protein
MLLTAGVYARRDFMVHLAGLNKKKKLIREVLQQLKEEQFDDRTQEKQHTNQAHEENLPLWQQCICGFQTERNSSILVMIILGI